MNRAFVTGGSGFIGHRLVYALAQRQVNLRLLSRSQQPDVDTVVCDLQLDTLAAGALAEVDTVFHLAGYTHDVRHSSDKEPLYRALNVDATVRLAELASRSGVKRFVFVSSVKAGGYALPGQCMTELDQGDPEGIYGETKRQAELEVIEIGQRSKMHVSIVRPCLVYGPDSKGNLKTFLEAVMEGWFPPLPETSNRRSMIHVDDLVRALLLVAEDERANGEIYIATDGVDYSTRAMYQAMRLAMGKRSMAVSVPRFLFAAAAWLGDQLGGKFPFDSYKMQKLLGDECYSSAKLSGLGFTPEHTLHSALPEMVAALRADDDVEKRY